VARLKNRRSGVGSAIAKFEATINAAIEKFETDEKAARIAAAKTATQTTRKYAGRTRKQDAGDRPGRPAGHLNRTLRWRPAVNASMVGFDLGAADSQSEYWIIQEIGTNARAVIRRAGRSNPRGAPASGATYIKSVPSQIGRRLSRGLAFGTAPGGRFVLPGGAGQFQQIYAKDTLTGGWVDFRKNSPSSQSARIVIRHEIKGKQMVKFGAEEGFRQYEQAVLTAAQQAFDGHPKPG
jgi:hypothetical protein